MGDMQEMKLESEQSTARGPHLDVNSGRLSVRNPDSFKGLAPLNLNLNLLTPHRATQRVPNHSMHLQDRQMQMTNQPQNNHGNSFPECSDQFSDAMGMRPITMSEDQY